MKFWNKNTWVFPRSMNNNGYYGNNNNISSFRNKLLPFVLPFLSNSCKNNINNKKNEERWYNNNEENQATKQQVKNENFTSHLFERSTSTLFNLVSVRLRPIPAGWNNNDKKQPDITIT